MGPELLFSDQVHAEKHRLDGEDFREATNRVANALKDSDTHFHALRDIYGNMRQMMAGRVQIAMGASHAVTPYNCFVSGPIEDSFTKDDGSIMMRATQAARTMQLGGGIGYDFSLLRPKGELIRGVMALTDGPLAFLPIYNAICEATSSSGNRRGAMMGVMRIDHPDIEAFIHVKQKLGVLEGFNLSVAVTDEFMECLASGQKFALRWGGKIYRWVDPEALWDMLMRSTWDWGEPGVIFIDTVNKMNNLWYCETIAATNPCGEQPLPPFGACLLGSFNLTRYVHKDIGGFYYFDYDQFKADIPHVVRAADNVVDRAIYPLPEQEAEAKSKRRMGLGVTGLANAGEVLGFPYGSPEFLEFEREVLTVLRDEAYLASTELAAEKGSFPLFNAELFLQSGFAKTLPGHVRHAIRTKGLRNSHLTSIAPTGTISIAMDYVSSGVEPVFSYGGERLVRMASGETIAEVSDYGYREFGIRGKLAADITAQEHLDVLTVASGLVDSAVSKTCNVDGSMPWEQFKGIYRQAWKRGCKGCTTFNKDGKRMGILRAEKIQEESEPEYGSCSIDPATGRKDCS